MRFITDDVAMQVHVTYLSSRRAVAALGAEDLDVTHIRTGEQRTFVSGAAADADPDLDRPLPFWLDRTVRFRPVRKDAPYCMH